MITRKTLTVDIVELEGSAYEIGVTQGTQINLEKTFEVRKEMNPRTFTKKAVKLMKVISPNFLQELTGLADGLNIGLDEVIKIYSGYGVEFPSMGCTALTHDSYYVRNYDFSPELYDARLVFSKPDNAYASVGFSQQIIGRLDGMNEKGLVIGLHFVNQQHHQEGFLATTISRIVLDQCGNLEEAIELIKYITHGYCFNYSITDKSGKSVIVEASPEKQVVHRFDAHICTNHFEADSLKEKNRANIKGSLKRKNFLQGLANENLSPLSAYKLFNDEDSPLFYKYYKEYFGTLHTVVYCPQDLNIIVGVGGDCEPLIFSFRDWLAGKLDLPPLIKGQIV